MPRQGLLLPSLVFCFGLFSVRPLAKCSAQIKMLPVLESENDTTSSANDTITSSEQLTENTDKFLCQFYTAWSPWSRCNRRCEQHRIRMCNVPHRCGTSFLKQKRKCYRKWNRCSGLSYKVIGNKRNRHIEKLLYDILYDSWSKWSRCSRSCKKRRIRRCREPKICDSSIIQEEKNCRHLGRKCEKRYTITPSNRDAMTKKKARRKKRRKEKNNANLPTEKYGAQSSMPDILDTISSECGLRPISGSFRIVGGVEAQNGSWPWQVAILTSKLKDQYCGGTLIAPGWVLTAAHCIRKRGRRRKVIVRVGAHSMTRPNRYHRNMRVEKDFPHEHFDYKTITNDIALLKLKKPEKIKNIAGYACLPPSSDFAAEPSAMCKIVGWGKRRNYDDLGSDVLIEADVPIVLQKTCRHAFDYPITNKQVCAGFQKGGVDSCAGDSGGPLLCEHSYGGRKRWMVYGVTSYGEGCGQEAKFGIYTKVANYVKWIEQTIRKNS